MEATVYSLHSLLNDVKFVIENSFKTAVWVRAEILKMNVYRTGHCYIDLVEKENNVVTSRIQGIIWKSNYQLITQKFRQTTESDIQDGMQLQMKVMVRFDPYYGISLNIIDVDPTYNLGLVALEKRMTLLRLQKENLLMKNKSLEVPLLPHRIAVISVETGKGFNDFVSMLKRYSDKYTIVYKLYPSVLQGNAAAESLRNALRRVSLKKDMFDVVCILRGGGSDLDLACYNNYELARDIALFPIPVVTGIGHELDESACQVVAAVGCDTPTDAALFLLNRFELSGQQLKSVTDSIKSNLQSYFGHQKQQLSQTTMRTLNLFSLSLRMEHRRIADIASHLPNIAEKRAEGENNKLQQILNSITTTCKQLITNEKRMLDLISQKVEMTNLNRKRILDMGYSLTTDINGKPIVGIDELQPNDTIITHLRNGSIESKINEIKKKI